MSKETFGSAAKRLFLFGRLWKDMCPFCSCSKNRVFARNTVQCIKVGWVLKLYKFAKPVVIFYMYVVCVCVPILCSCPPSVLNCLTNLALSKYLSLFTSISLVMQPYMSMFGVANLLNTVWHKTRLTFTDCCTTLEIFVCTFLCLMPYVCPCFSSPTVFAHIC